jgi:hypothetical protein
MLVKATKRTAVISKANLAEPIYLFHEYGFMNLQDEDWPAIPSFIAKDTGGKFQSPIVLSNSSSYQSSFSLSVALRCEQFS